VPNLRHVEYFHGLTHRYADTERYRRGWRWPSSVASWRRAGCARG